ncbi:MAG: amidohydrolase family protein, partial [Clostridiales Family XIII bacterium]|nr:amidohydrolase family protein [Clostridiales Family XIII bacterium]
MSTRTTILRSRSLFTGLTAAPCDGIVVLEGERIAGVGSAQWQEAFPGADIRDLGDRTLLPAFHDAHLHLILGAMSEKGGFLREDRSEEAAALHFYELNPDRAGAGEDANPWLLGGAWDHFLWPGGRLPSKGTLDRYFPDRRVFLLNKECHGAWVNSRALAHFGICKDTPDPPFGRIFRDADGEPTGYLHEAAAFVMLSRILGELPAQGFAEYVGSFAQKALSYGITAVADMPISGISSWEVYDALEARGGLELRIHYCVPFAWSTQEMLRLQRLHKSGTLRFSGAKEFVDGTPMGYTGYMLEPYSDRQDTCGSPAVDIDFLREKLAELACAGIRTRLHCCGDRAVRTALDSIEHAAKRCRDAGQAALGQDGMRLAA